MDFIKNMYEEGLVEKHLDEDAWANIRSQRIDRLKKERSVALYGYLVGIENAWRAKKTVELTLEGNKAIPSNYIKGYAPIIDMLDDIVQAGPAYITQLKQLHKRAKKDLK
jgi:hypothetical protein